jgi:hypothetical protein
MKRHSKQHQDSSKLKLRKQTIRTISTQELSQVAGGWDFTTTTCLGGTKLHGE